jgi:release factor glutamine methyltransferase
MKVKVDASGPKPDIKTVSGLLNLACLKLKGAGLETPGLDAEVLLAFCMKESRIRLLAHPEMPVNAQTADMFESLLERRTGGEPVAYLTGRKEFWSLSFAVDPRVLIPRPETEILVEDALRFAAENFSRADRIAILEIGTGSGAISVALASELPRAEITATDISMGAIELASLNAAGNNVAGQIRFVAGSFFEPVAGRFDLIVSNPPYISAAEYAGLSPRVRDFEPPEALLAGPDGTEFHKAIIAGAEDFLNPRGALFLEIGALQKQKIEEILRKEGYNLIDFRKDYAGLFRVARARRQQIG